MRVSLPFPKCHSCGKDSVISYHRNCGGKMQVEIQTDEVYCEKCKHHWNIWDSKYHCSCGAIFEAREVRKALMEVLACCRACADELADMDKAKKERTTESKKSFRSFVSGFIEGIGYSFGLSIGTIVDVIISLFFK